MLSVCRAVLCVELYGYVGMCVELYGYVCMCMSDCVCLLYCGGGACVCLGLLHLNRNVTWTSRAKK